MRRLLFILIIFIVLPLGAKPGGNYISVRSYVKQWSPVAVKHMQQYGIPASIILAQAILESANGNSRMARNANNHFGIKCLGWGGESYFQNNNPKNSCYRKYECPEDSYRDYARIISTKNRYAFLFRLGKKDYKSWAKGLKKAGYATNPKYAQLLIKTIEDYRLYEYDVVEEEAASQQQPAPGGTPHLAE